MILPVRVLSSALATCLALAAGSVAAETSKTSQIYLQRQADGSAVLTDHPSANALTERVWKMDREDPIAARERAAEVRREADAVSLRVQRSIESQQRLASEVDALRLAAQQRQDVADDDSAVGGVIVPLGDGGFMHRPHLGRRHHWPGRHPHRSFRGSAWPAGR
ncbi:MAG TPA: hypothetical protein VFF72_10500 [Caldimonas sp.]|nr:hypothetical protein [Caldimonas sp.]